MLVKDIILKACIFTANDELANLLEENGELDEEMNSLLEKFVKCFNLVQNEIASEYEPLLKEEVVETQDGKILFSSLKERVVDVVSVKDMKGNSILFKNFDDYIEVNCPKVEIWYNAYPKKLTLEDELTSTIPERVYAYGTAREYYFIESLYEDASIWDERFKNSLQNLIRKKSQTIMPAGRWV